MVWWWNSDELSRIVRNFREVGGRLEIGPVPPDASGLNPDTREILRTFRARRAAARPARTALRTIREEEEEG